MASSPPAIAAPDRGSRRRPRSPRDRPSRLVRRAPSLDRLSVFSDQTHRTGFSSESNRTISQESYDHARKTAADTLDIFQFLEKGAVQEVAPVIAAHELDLEEDDEVDNNGTDGDYEGLCESRDGGVGQRGDRHSEEAMEREENDGEDDDDDEDDDESEDEDEEEEEEEKDDDNEAQEDVEDVDRQINDKAADDHSVGPWPDTTPAQSKGRTHTTDREVERQDGSATTPGSDVLSIHSSGAWDSGISMGSDSPSAHRGKSGTTQRSPDDGSFLEQKSADQKTHRTSMDILDTSWSRRHGSPALLTVKQGTESSPRPLQELGKLSGYDLLAHALVGPGEPGAKSIPRLYRTFDHLQHRTLLHLQDLLAEGEAELKRLDESIAPFFLDTNGKRHPQSRRADRVQLHTMGAQRHQLLDGLTHHLAHYDILMSAMKTSASNCEAANAEQIETYRAWLASQNAIVHSEGAFVKHAPDLICLAPRPDAIRTPPFSSFFAGLLAGMCVMVIALLVASIRAYLVKA